MYKPALIAGIICAGLAVVLGAFGAHGLKKIATPETIDNFQKGVTYQFYHAFALLVCGILFASFPAPSVRLASWLFLAGIILFSGSLYVLSWAKIKDIDTGMFGIVTPIGGLAFISGWIALLLAIIKSK